MDGCQALLDQQCRHVCTRDLEQHVIRPLAVCLGVLPGERDVLSMTAADVEAERGEYPGEYDFLDRARTASGRIKAAGSELFPVDGPLSKYHSLFDPRSGFDALRSAFLTSTLDRWRCVVELFEDQVASASSATDAPYAQEVVTSLRCMLQLRQTT